MDMRLNQDDIERNEISKMSWITGHTAGTGEWWKLTEPARRSNLYSESDELFIHFIEFYITLVFGHVRQALYGYIYFFFSSLFHSLSKNKYSVFGHFFWPWNYKFTAALRVLILHLPWQSFYFYDFVSSCSINTLEVGWERLDWIGGDSDTQNEDEKIQLVECFPSTWFTVVWQLQPVISPFSSSILSQMKMTWN